MLLIPDWPHHPRVQAVSTTRQGGVSVPPYQSFNLALHVGDDPVCVQQNRDLLCQRLPAEHPPLWLNQVHSQRVIDSGEWQAGIEADGCYTRQANTVCVVMTADCLPVLLADHAGTVVAAVHAGWRGLCEGILEQAVKRMGVSAGALRAWIGPAISVQHFQVGDEVKQAFLQATPSLSEALQAAFLPSTSGHWMADLVQIARLRLDAVGVTSVHGGDQCSYADAEQYFSYRREATTGRMASMIWLTE